MPRQTGKIIAIDPERQVFGTIANAAGIKVYFSAGALPVGAAMTDRLIGRQVEFLERQRPDWRRQAVKIEFI